MTQLPTGSRPYLASNRLKGWRILLVDDAPDNQTLVSRYLMLAGAIVETANDGVEAIEKALSLDFDVVLMDIQMPIMDGLVATETLRRKGYNKPIIALTAHAMLEERQRCFAAGCTDHITKPIDRQLLEEKIIHYASQRA